MKKEGILVLTMIIALGISACGTNKTDDVENTNDSKIVSESETISESEVIGGADEPTAISLPAAVSENDNADEHFLAYLSGNETDAKGETFWAVGEPDIEYALYDMNGDGTNELIVRAYGYWIFDIIEYKDNKIQYANVENLGSSGVTFINDQNQFVSGDTGHEGRTMYVVSALDEQGSADMVMALVNYYDDWAESGAPEFYKKENPSPDYLDEIDRFDTITEGEYNALVEKYSQENTSIEWIKLDVDDQGKQEDRKDQKNQESKENVETQESRDRISDDQALAAIRNYCISNNPTLEQYSKEGSVYWEISSSEADRIVVVFRSYTGAFNYYYIDPVTGDTYVTERVPGIIDEEQMTDEKFNLRDYLR